MEGHSDEDEQGSAGLLQWEAEAQDKIKISEMKKNDRCRKAEQLAKVCAVKHLWRQDQEVGAASCCFYSKQLLAGTMGSREKK